MAESFKQLNYLNLEVKPEQRIKLEQFQLPCFSKSSVEHLVHTPDHPQLNLKPVTRIVKIHFDLIWPHDLVAPEYAMIYDKDSYNICHTVLPLYELGIWPQTYDQVICLRFLQVWQRNEYERWPDNPDTPYYAISSDVDSDFGE